MNKQAVKRVCITALMIFTAYILQCSAVRYISLASIGPNIIIVVIASYALMHGEVSGMLTGFFAGILIDIQFGEVIGLYAFIYLCIGYACGSFHQHYSRDNLKLPMIIFTVSEFIYGFVICIFMFILRGEFHFIYYLTHNIIPELVYTAVVAFPIYMVIVFIDQKIEIAEKRGA